MSHSGSSDVVYDIIGLGFGPANIAISGALVEKWQHTASNGAADVIRPNRVLFLERHTEFRWHPGMLLPNTRMQISFLKDLATLRSPQSPITFLAYLHAQNRLLPFINRGSFTPTRKEFSDYLSWAAQYVQDQGINANYGEEIISLKESDDDTVEVRSRRLSTGEEFVRRTKNLILSPGGSGKFPAALSVLAPDHPKVIHSSSYATSIDDILSSIGRAPSSEKPLRIAIVGSGQSSAEVLLDLYSRFGGKEGENVELDLIFRKGSIKPSDDSPFANEIFDPASTDMLFGLPSQRARKNVLAEYENTNYGVVNPRTIDALYEVMYDQQLDDAMRRRGKDQASRARITFKPYTQVLSAEDTTTSPHDETSPATDREPGRIRMVLQNVLSHEVSDETYDAVICGTGYDRTSWVRLLGSSDIGKYFGLHSSSSIVELVPSSHASVREIEDVAQTVVRNVAEANSSWQTPSSESSTPLTSPGPSPSLSTSQLLHQLHSTKLYVTRTYRLLPVRSAESSSEKLFAPRVYLQGCTESTHGLSDSLLSILGVRAGLVVDDLLNNN